MISRRFTQEDYDVIGEAMSALREEAMLRFICYGRPTLDFGLLDDCAARRVGSGLWPTRDAAAPQEEC